MKTKWFNGLMESFFINDLPIKLDEQNKPECLEKYKNNIRFLEQKHEKDLNQNQCNKIRLKELMIRVKPLFDLEKMVRIDDSYENIIFIQYPVKITISHGISGYCVHKSGVVIDKNDDGLNIDDAETKIVEIYANYKFNKMKH